MALPPALWSDPFPSCLPFMPSWIFPRSALWLRHEFSDRELVLIEIPTPTLLASWVVQPPCSQHPTLSSLMCVTLSCEHLHKFPITQEQILLVIVVLSQGRDIRHFGAKYRVLIVEVLLSSFSNTGDIYAPSQIFWVFRCGYILPIRSKLKTVKFVIRSTFSRES